MMMLHHHVGQRRASGLQEEGG